MSDSIAIEKDKDRETESQNISVGFMSNITNLTATIMFIKFVRYFISNNNENHHKVIYSKF